MNLNTVTIYVQTQADPPSSSSCTVQATFIKGNMQHVLAQVAKHTREYDRAERGVDGVRASSQQTSNDDSHDHSILIDWPVSLYSPPPFWPWLTAMVSMRKFQVNDECKLTQIDLLYAWRELPHDPHTKYTVNTKPYNGWPLARRTMQPLAFTFTNVVNMKHA